MYNFVLKDVFLGINDGKKEAKYRRDFERFFYDYNNIVGEIHKPEKYIVLGRKGSGKTILGEYLNKKAKSEPCHFCQIYSYKDIKFRELIKLKTNDVKPNEYMAIWEWVILLNIGRSILQDNRITNTQYLNKLEKFFKENYYSIEIDSQKIIEMTQQNKINGKAFGISAEYGKKKLKQVASYLNYLEHLNDVIFELLKFSQSKYTIIYDELDDRF